MLFFFKIHKRRSAQSAGSGISSGKRTTRSKSSKVQTQNDRLKQLNERLKARIAEHKTSSLPNGGTTTESESEKREERRLRQQANMERRYRSIRELTDLTVLDRIQSQIRVELEENLKSLRKLESQNEFNSIVARIRDFLISSELDRSQASTPISVIAPRIRVYEYNMFNETPELFKRKSIMA